jgi:hypothetical protein
LIRFDLAHDLVRSASQVMHAFGLRRAAFGGESIEKRQRRNARARADDAAMATGESALRVLIS